MGATRSKTLGQRATNDSLRPSLYGGSHAPREMCDRDGDCDVRRIDVVTVYVCLGRVVIT